MPLVRFPPVLSTPANVYTRASRAEAVSAALLGGPQMTTAYANLLGIWPQIRTYENDPAGLSIPFVWGNTNFNPGETLGFACVVNAALPSGSYAYTLGALGDNAHRAFLEIYTVTGQTITLAQSIVSDLDGGSFDPAIPQSPPYNWQLARSSSGTFNTEGTGFLVLSFTVLNYYTPAGLPNGNNPAMLSFGFQLFAESAPT